MIDLRPAGRDAGGARRRTFNIRPLLNPPAAGKDKLDQVLEWLAEQAAILSP